MHILKSEQYLKFYEIMKYPVPINEYFYYHIQEKTIKNKEIPWKTISNLKSFSRKKKDKILEEYLETINQLEKTFMSIPYVEKIYLCNSITFNALNDSSDIDLLIVTKPWKIRTTKLWSMLLFFIKWQKRNWNNKRKKICLSFFITSESQNLYWISIPWIDIYLCYWISHLVLLYIWDTYDKNNDIFKKNKRVKGILPNYQEKQTINLWNKIFMWNTKLKNFIEYIWDSKIWDFTEFMAKLIQKTIITLKKRIFKKRNKDVIISDSMLKFHQDIRAKISLKYNLKIKQF